MTESELNKLYAKKLESSGLGNGDLKRLQFVVHTDPTKLNIVPALPGFTIPYFDVSGKKTKHFRFRYLVDTRDQWEKLAKSKARRYSQPKNSGLEVYLPPILEDWQDVFGDNTQPIIITEGELKAACACKRGFPTVGLGGVWAFMKEDAPLPFFDEVRWEERRVYICYDSDAATNPHVNKAEARLAKLLGELGARPHILRLPSPKDTKVGLDDYLLDKGEEKFAELIKDAEPYHEVAVLHELNEELLVILNPSMIVKRADNYLMGRANFLGVNYADRVHYTEQISRKGEIKRTKVKSAEAWLEWPGRATAQRIVFAPGKPEFTEDGGYNTWKGWPLRPDPRAGIQPWIDILDYAFQHSDPSHRKWFEQWCAYPIQFPGEKLANATVMYGVEEGTGKTLIGLSLKEIYGAYGTMIGEDELHDGRNEWAANKQFILGDEVAGNDKRGVADRLRSMITRKELRLNIKFVPSYTIPDCVNYYFTSNRPDAFVMSATDRRYFIHEMNDRPLPTEFYQEYEQWLYREGGAAALFAYMLDLDLTGFHAQAAAPTTAAKVMMQEFGRSDIANWVSELQRNPNEVLGDNKKDVFTTGELVMLYDPEGKKRSSVGLMGRVLKELNMWQPNKGNPVPVAGSSKRLYVARNVEHWHNATLSALVEHYEGKTQVKQRKYK